MLKINKILRGYISRDAINHVSTRLLIFNKFYGLNNT